MEILLKHLANRRLMLKQELEDVKAELNQILGALQELDIVEYEIKNLIKKSDTGEFSL